MNDSISVEAINELKRHVETEYDLCVSSIITEVNGQIIISFAKKRKNIVLDKLSWLDTINFLPQSPTNDSDTNDRRDLFWEIKRQMN
jgi:hypothetical protein